MKNIYVAHRRIALDSASLLGEGGEAEVYDISSEFPDMAAKIWKPPSHADFQGATEEARRNKQGAADRIVEYAKKISLFPKNLPRQVIAPVDPALSAPSGGIVGFTMPKVVGGEVLRRYTQRAFRRSSGLDANQMVSVFRSLHQTVQAVHQGKVVIGDFNNLNVLVKGLEAILIDADSYQFGSFLAKTFTTRFVDPLICDPTQKSLVQKLHHSVASDWYAFALMLFECMTFVHPYGGVYEPKNARQQLALDARPLKRISVLNPQVTYPAKGIPFGNLPDELLHFYSQLLEKDVRGEFPQRLLEQLRWTTCSACGTEHARAKCPNCAQPSPRHAVVEFVRGQVKVSRLFGNRGTIICAATQSGKPLFLTYQGGILLREDGKTVVDAASLQGVRARIIGGRTVIAREGTMAIMESGKEPQMEGVDSFRGGRPVFDVNESHIYWVSQGRLLRDGEFGPKFIGPVLRNQTVIWAGARFGVALTKAGGYQQLATFDAERPGLTPVAAFAPIVGELLDAQAYFSEQRCWLFVSTKSQGKVINTCTTVSADGQVHAVASGEEDDGTWLEGIAAKVALTIGTPGNLIHALLAATERGMVRIEEQGTALEVSKEFSDTKGVIPSDSKLLISSQGLVMVGRDSASVVRLG